ncbi:DNA ligase 1 [Eurytemora carolleeae]|uniref:DNA ligase 1 n=1 Tax=Eurytemora carolleeae TaxID=1294199 RepID=UPI000C771E0E|nr:DNA ligase 1 [Eurytemora carolleeae]|eukprot:XP_023331634.1 DNA ligase 1-like [Eurytemora affinis]
MVKNEVEGVQAIMSIHEISQVRSAMGIIDTVSGGVVELERGVDQGVSTLRRVLGLQHKVHRNDPFRFQRIRHQFSEELEHIHQQLDHSAAQILPRQGPHTIHFLAEQPLLVVFFITLIGTIIACGISAIVQTNLLRQDSKAITELHDAGNLITLVGDVAINEEFGEPRLEIEKMDSQENAKEDLIEKEDIKCASKDSRFFGQRIGGDRMTRTADECSELCAQNEDCKYWTWFQKNEMIDAFENVIDSLEDEHDDLEEKIIQEDEEEKVEKVERKERKIEFKKDKEEREDDNRKKKEGASEKIKEENKKELKEDEGEKEEELKVDEKEEELKEDEDEKEKGRKEEELKEDDKNEETTKTCWLLRTKTLSKKASGVVSGHLDC